MRIGDDLALALFTGEGKPLKSLPKPGVKDDADLAKAARSAFTAAKKELRQIVDEQSARLLEAMALGRSWPADTWRTALLEHPVMRHLVSRLVWATGEVQEESTPVRDDGADARGVVLFAPTLDGELLDIEDGEVELAEQSRVWLTHASRLEAGTAQRWRDRLADYGVSPLFEQFGVASADVAPDAAELADREGWMVTIGALKTQMTRRGYRLSSAVDGGWMGSVIKAIGPWTVVVGITGVYPGQAAGESIALTRLQIERDGQAQPLGEVPTALLAIAFTDYLAIADAGAHDPDWAKRTNW